MVLSRDLARFGLFGEAEIWSRDSFPNLICKNLGKNSFSGSDQICPWVIFVNYSWFLGNISLPNTRQICLLSVLGSRVLRVMQLLRTHTAVQAGHRLSGRYLTCRQCRGCRTARPGRSSRDSGLCRPGRPSWGGLWRGGRPPACGGDLCVTWAPPGPPGRTAPSAGGRPRAVEAARASRSAYCTSQRCRDSDIAASATDASPGGRGTPVNGWGLTVNCLVGKLWEFYGTWSMHDDGRSCYVRNGITDAHEIRHSEIEAGNKTEQCYVSKSAFRASLP